MTLVTEMVMDSPMDGSKHRAEPVQPISYRLVTDIDAALK